MISEHEISISYKEVKRSFNAGQGGATVFRRGEGKDGGGDLNVTDVCTVSDYQMTSQHYCFLRDFYFYFSFTLFAIFTPFRIQFPVFFKVLFLSYQTAYLNIYNYWACWGFVEFYQTFRIVGMVIN